MDDVIAITVRSVYGVDKYYPFNEQAKKLAAIAGTTTLTEPTLRMAVDMGFTLRRITPDRDAALVEILGEYTATSKALRGCIAELRRMSDEYSDLSLGAAAITWQQALDAAESATSEGVSA